VRQPPTARSDDVVAALRDLRLDGILVVAYGELLPPAILEVPIRGCLNLHASLLPRWRGAAPVQAAILAGDTTTGVTLMRMDTGMDTGPILAQRSVPIGPSETSGELVLRLADIGAGLISESLAAWSSGSLQATPQPAHGATLAPRLRKDSGRLDFGQPADLLERQVRAFNPWPGSFFTVDSTRVVVLRATPLPEAGREPGWLVYRGGELVVSARPGALRLDLVQPAGRRPMPGPDFLRGSPQLAGRQVPPAPQS
jgi:methionyl-tRNA formyltransferase